MMTTPNARLYAGTAIVIVVTILGALTDAGRTTGFIGIGGCLLILSSFATEEVR